MLSMLREEGKIIYIIVFCEKRSMLLDGISSIVDDQDSYSHWACLVIPSPYVKHEWFQLPSTSDNCSEEIVDVFWSGKLHP